MCLSGLWWPAASSTYTYSVQSSKVWLKWLWHLEKTDGLPVCEYLWVVPHLDDELAESNFCRIGSSKVACIIYKMDLTRRSWVSVWNPCPWGCCNDVILIVTKKRPRYLVSPSIGGARFVICQCDCVFCQVFYVPFCFGLHHKKGLNVQNQIKLSKKCDKVMIYKRINR